MHLFFKDQGYENIADLNKVFEEAAEDPDSILSAAQVGVISKKIEAGTLIPEGIGVIFATPPNVGNEEYAEIKVGDAESVRERVAELSEDLNGAVNLAIQNNGGSMPSRDSSLWKHVIQPGLDSLNDFVSVALGEEHNPEFISNTIKENLSKGAVNVFQPDFHKDLGFKPSAGKSTAHQQSQLWQNSKKNLTNTLSKIGISEMDNVQISQEDLDELEYAVQNHLNLYDADPATKYPSNLSGEVYKILNDTLGNVDNHDFSALINELNQQFEDNIDGYNLNSHEQSRGKIQSILDSFEQEGYDADSLQASDKIETLADTIREHLANVQNMNLSDIDCLGHDEENDRFTVSGGDSD